MSLVIKPKPADIRDITRTHISRQRQDFTLGHN